MVVVEVTSNHKNLIQDFYNMCCLTYEGMAIPSKLDISGRKKIEDSFRNGGYKEKEFTIYKISGKTMNEYFGLTGDNAYKDDLNIIVIPDFYNVAFKMQTGGRWFDDIVSSNSIRQNGINSDCEPDFN